MTDQTTPLRDRIAAAARTIQLRLGSNAVAMAQRGEPIILNLNEADDLADAVLAAVLPATTNHDTDTGVADADVDTVANRAAQAISAMGADIRELKRDRDRSRTAWHSARRRASVLSAEITRRAPLLGEYATEIERLRRELAASERIRENADFHLGQEMARRQRAEKEAAELRRVADETAATETNRTPCSVPECDADGTGEPCTRHEREDAHAEGDHELCGPDCPEQPAAGVRQDETVAVPCVECDHPQTDHGEGEDPVTPGQCQACPDDDAWHDYQAATKQQDGAQPGDAE